MLVIRVTVPVVPVVTLSATSPSCPPPGHQRDGHRHRHAGSSTVTATLTVPAPTPPPRPSPPSPRPSSTTPSHHHCTWATLIPTSTSSGLTLAAPSPIRLLFMKNKHENRKSLLIFYFTIGAFICFFHKLDVQDLYFYLSYLHISLNLPFSLYFWLFL